MLRRALPVAIGGFVFSALIGAVAGVSLVTVVVRALVVALISGAVAAGVLFAVERFLPGLLTAEEGGSTAEFDEDAAAAASPGATVDIVVEESDESGFADLHSGADGDTDLVEEVHEQTADDASAVMDDAIAEEGGRLDVGGGSLDEMPDIGAFASSFVSTPASVATAPEDDEETDGQVTFEPSFPDESHSGTASGTGGPNDPAQIARAIQTILKREDR